MLEWNKKEPDRRGTGWISPRNGGGSPINYYDEASTVGRYAERRKEDVKEAETSIAPSAGRFQPVIFVS
jgi:hypothetical protein